MFSIDDEHAEKRRQAGLNISPATKTVVIYFTARSASSWLTSLLEKTERLGRGIELFNPEFMPKISRHFGARNLEEYIYYAKRFTHRSGVFSFEATPGHIIKVFGNGDKFEEKFHDSYKIILFRENIVSQGISLAKMVNNNISHAPSLTSDQVEEADKSFLYDSAIFKKWINHILNHELWLENHIKTQKTEHLILTYEQITSEGAVKTLNRISKHISVEPPAGGYNVTSLHRKIGSKLNEKHELRFRESEVEFIEKVEAQRQCILNRIIKN